MQEYGSSDVMKGNEFYFMGGSERGHIVNNNKQRDGKVEKRVIGNVKKYKRDDRR